jgi:hypothetical protein
MQQVYWNPVSHVQIQRVRYLGKNVLWKSDRMTARKSFSVRHGINAEPTPIVNDAPDAVRFFILEELRTRLDNHAHGIAQLIGKFLRSPAFANSYTNHHRPDNWDRLYRELKSWEWWRFYEFVEFFYDPNSLLYRGLTTKLNEVFDEHNVQYRMTLQGEIVYKGSEVFEVVVAAAQKGLADSGRTVAKNEIHEALQDLSRRPTPDLSGAVHHAMNALEMVTNDVCGTSGETLGSLIKKNPERFHPPLDIAIEKMWGFASNKGRHLRDGSLPERREVDLLVGIAAVMITYLIGE